MATMKGMPEEDANEMRMASMNKGMLPGLNKLPRKAKKGMKKGK